MNECLPDEEGGVEQTYNGRDIDAHQYLAVDVHQAEVAVLHLSVGRVIMEQELHLKKTCGERIRTAESLQLSPSFSNNLLSIHSPM